MAAEDKEKMDPKDLQEDMEKEEAAESVSDQEEQAQKDCADQEKKQEEKEVKKDSADEETRSCEKSEKAPDSQEKNKESKSEGFFKKKLKKDKRDEQIEELTDKVKRQMAEFENFRRRSEKEKSQMYEIGARSIVEKILPVIDNFERGLAGVEEGKEDPFVAGMQMVYKQLLTSLSEAGVKPIEAVGKEFDPDFHNAVMHVEDDAYGENEVIEELQKGYMYRETVVRHSMVKVAN